MVVPLFFKDRNLQTHLGYVGRNQPVTRQLTVDTDAIFSLSAESPSFSLLDDSYMRIKESLSGGAWITNDSERTANIGYAGPKVPVIRMETIINSSGAKVAMINIRGGSLAEVKGWVSYQDLEPREGGSSDSSYGSGASAIISAVQNGAANAGVKPDSPAQGSTKRRVM